MSASPRTVTRSLNNIVMIVITLVRVVTLAIKLVAWVHPHMIMQCNKVSVVMITLNLLMVVMVQVQGLYCNNHADLC